MDIYDRAQELEERERAGCIAMASRPSAAAPIATGACLHCEAPVAEGHRFCDADCRDQWERHRAAQLRNGGVGGHA